MRMLTLGGATEASIHSTIYEVTRVDPAWASIPYGRPMANQRTYILDDAFQPVPPASPASCTSRAPAWPAATSASPSAPPSASSSGPTAR